MSLFDDIGGMSPIEAAELYKLYIDDPSPLKVTLGVGAYRTDDGNPWVLPGTSFLLMNRFSNWRSADGCLLLFVRELIQAWECYSICVLQSSKKPSDKSWRIPT